MQALGLLRRMTLMRSQPAHFVLQRQYAKKKEFVFPTITMNDLPQPQGDFYTQHNARQRVYNIQLVLGVGSVILTVAFGLATDMFHFFNDIPEIPAEIDCYND